MYNFKKINGEEREKLKRGSKSHTSSSAGNRSVNLKRCANDKIKNNKIIKGST